MMKEINHAYVDRYLGVRSDSSSVALFFGVSIFLHLILIGTLVVMPKITSRPRFAAGVVNVSLVSLPAKAPAAGSGNQTVAQPKPEVKKPAKAAVSEIPPPPKTAPVLPKPAEKVSLAPKPKPKAKTSLKKETLDRAKVIEHAVDRIQKKVDESEAESVKTAIDRLKKKVEETETADPQRYRLGKGNGGVGEQGMAQAGAGGGPQVIEAIKIYQAEIQYQIQKNWAFSQQLAGDITDLETVLAIKILPNGEIEDIWFDKKSGNDYLDNSAYKAIVKSNPLPSLPREYSGPYYEIGLIFGPKGLK